MFAHIDADAFFASVLQRKFPKLKNKPLLALGMGGGCVIAASYEAKRKGVKAGMRLRDAKKLAPEAISMPANFRATYEATVQLFNTLEEFCPRGVEKASPDEGYLDLECVETPRRSVSWHAFASTLQNHIAHHLDLPVSIGIAPSKTLAKMCSTHKKPRGIFIVQSNVELEEFQKEKLIESIPGIGRRLTPKLQAYEITTAYEFAHAPVEQIKTLLGKIGLELQKEVQGIAVHDVVTQKEKPKSISRCRSFPRTSDKNFMYAHIVTHLQRCSMRLRRHDLECARLSVWLRTSEYTGTSVEKRIGRYVNEEALLLPFAKEAFEEAIHVMLSRAESSSTRSGASATLESSSDEARIEARIPPIMQTGIVLYDVRPKGGRQISLFEETRLHERIGGVQKALDTLREKYGNESVRYGGAISTQHR